MGCGASSLSANESRFKHKSSIPAYVRLKSNATRVSAIRCSVNVSTNPGNRRAFSYILTSIPCMVSTVTAEESARLTSHPSSKSKSLASHPASTQEADMTVPHKKKAAILFIKYFIIFCSVNRSFLNLHKEECGLYRSIPKHRAL